jgi:hypothetical protein
MPRSVDEDQGRSPRRAVAHSPKADGQPLFGFARPPHGPEARGQRHTGAAGRDQFRSAPFWGVGQRIFFLHDGRPKSLVEAIHGHYSVPSAAHGNTPAYPASEANQVVRNFANLRQRRQQDIIDFLRAPAARDAYDGQTSGGRH